MKLRNELHYNFKYLIMFSALNVEIFVYRLAVIFFYY